MPDPHASIRFEPGRWRRVLAGAGLAAGLFTAGAAPAQDDPSGRAGRVAEITGEVRTIDREGAWVPLSRNQPLATGDRVVTGNGGRATLQIGSTTVRVGADSDLAVTQLDDRKIRLRFDHGQVAVRVRSDDILGELFIETDEGAWVPHHPGQYRFDRVAHQVLAAQAWTGDMLLEAPDSSLPVAAPRRAEVWRTGAQQATHFRWVPAAPRDAFGDAVLAQDALDDRQAAANVAAQVPLEMTGAADLARFGTWSVATGGMHVWTPAKLPAGWQPYQQGAWSWIPPWGWTWIDDQAWGFAPFHYGRWMMARGHWSWTPGQWGATRPVYAPALVGWFGGPSLRVAGAPALGWVALAPEEAFYPGYAVSGNYWHAVNDATVSPANRRAPAAIKGHVRFVPTGALAYAHLGMPGAIAVVAGAALLPQVPVSTMPALHGQALHDLAADVRRDGLSPLAPPAPPAGKSALSASAAVLGVPATAPSASAAGSGVAAKPATPIASP